MDASQHWGVAVRTAYQAADRSSARYGTLTLIVIATAFSIGLLLSGATGYAHGFVVSLVGIIAAAWRWGFGVGLVIAISLGLLTTGWTLFEGHETAVVIRDNAVFFAIGIGLAVFFSVASELNRRLSEANREIRRLHGLLPICASCKKIRDENGNWRQIEDYFSTHSEAQFSHAICETCSKKLYGRAGEFDSGQQPD